MTSAAQPPGQDMTSIPAMKVTNSLSNASPSTTLNRPVRKGGSGGSDEPPRSRRRSAFFFFFFFFLFGWQNLERALVCVKTAAIFPTKWVEFENPQPTNVCFDWEMCGNRRASNERSPTLHCEATCVRRNLLVFVHSRGPFLCRRKCPW